MKYRHISAHKQQFGVLMLVINHVSIRSGYATVKQGKNYQILMDN